MYDGQHCIDNEHAKSNPNLVFRGRGTKGVSIATRLTNTTHINQTKYYPRQLNKRSLQPIIKYTLKSTTHPADLHKNKHFHYQNQRSVLSSRHHYKKLSLKGDPDIITTRNGK